MPGLNHGTRYKRQHSESSPQSEGGYYSALSRKWVVRVFNKGNPYQYYRSLSQSPTEAGANQLFNDYKNKC